MPKHEAQILIGEQIKDATDIGPTMDAILAGTYQSEYPTEKLERYIEQLASHDLDHTVSPGVIWEELKEERNALGAIFIEKIWNEGELERIQAKEDLDEETGWRELQAVEFAKIARGAFVGSLNRYVSSMRSRMSTGLSAEQETQLDKAYYKFHTMFAFAKAAQIPRQVSESLYIERGIGTATDVTWGLIELIPRLAKAQGITLTPEQTVATIKNAYGPVVAQFASMNIEVAVPLLMQMRDIAAFPPGVSFDQTFFTLVPIREGEYKVVIDHDRLLNLRDMSGRVLLQSQPRSNTTMCPARKGNDVVKKYFDWSLGLAEQYYLPKVLSK